jgi:poly(ADP-ribose) glycohydrolase ARH3
LNADAARGALLGTFVGDALGMPYETAAPADVPERVEMVDARLGRGTYTDDTQMTIALAESLIACGRVDDEHLAATFLSRYDPDRGYGGGTREVLELWRAGVPVAEAAGRIFGGRGSRGNGAAMRVAPVAVLFAHDRERLEREAELSARVTHRHPVGVDAARVQAAAVGAAMRGDDVLAAAADAVRTGELASALERVRRLRAARPDPATAATELGNEPYGDRSLPTALLAAVSHDDFEGAVGYAVRCGGDADTIAAMAGAVAGARAGAGAIPARWLDALEDSERGRRYVESLAERLASSGGSAFGPSG